MLMPSRTSAFVACVIAASLGTAACGNSNGSGGGGSPNDASAEASPATGDASASDGGSPDAGPDAASANDGGVLDAGPADAGGANEAGIASDGGDRGDAGGSVDAGSPCAVATYATDCPTLACQDLTGCVGSICQYAPSPHCLAYSFWGTFGVAAVDKTIDAGGAGLTLHGTLGPFRPQDGTVCKGTLCLTGGIGP